jgi:protein ImuB
MKRVMCVRLPHWPLQRQRRERPEHNGPLVLYADAGLRGLRVTACSRRALEAGVRPGMPLAEAKALLENSKSEIRNPKEIRSTKFQSSAEADREDRNIRISNLASSQPWFALHDPAADRAALETLAGWCRRFSPVVGTEDPDSLLLDVTGCAHLFGGEEELARAVAGDFHRWGFTVRVALADAIGAAWAFAHYGDCQLKIDNCELKNEPQSDPDLQFPIFNFQFSILPASLRNKEKQSFQDFVASTRLPKNEGVARPESSKGVPPGASIRNPQSAIRISSLPIEALRLPVETVATLHELDIRRVEQLQALPRCTLPSRLGPEVLRRLDQALGDCPETIAPIRPPEPVEARHEFEHPTPQRFALEAALRRLVEQVLRELAGRMEGIQRLQVRMIYEDRRQDEFTVGLLRPAACAEHVTGLLFTRLERMVLSGNVAELQMTVAVSAPLELQQPQLFETGTNPAAEGELSHLLERLSARLGSERVVSPRLYPDAQPEYAVRWQPVGQAFQPDMRESYCKLQNENCKLKTGRRSKDNLQFSICNSQFAISPRPLRLLPDPQPIDVVSIVPDGPPLRFFRHGRSHTVARWWGPERIETGWWRHRHVRRDYYRVETEAGERFWIFRQPDTWEWRFQGEGA